MPFIAIGLCWIAALIGWQIQDPAVWVAYAFINPILFLMPRATFSFVPLIRNRLTKEWLKNVERIGLYVLLVNIPGSVYLHELGIQYDRFLHFAAGLLVYYAAILLLTPLFTKQLSGNKKKILGINFIATFIGLFIWELIQWSSDQLFGTHLFFDSKQPITLDVTEDIIFGFAGLLIALLIFRHSNKTWNRYAEKSFK